MSPWKTHGQEHLTAALDRALLEERLAHAYLLTGLVGVGKATLAIEMAQAVNCVEQQRPCGECQQCQRIQRGIHSDVQFVVPTEDERTGRLRTEIGIDQVRAMERSAALGPYEGKYRVFIIEGGERLSTEAANALLKMMEEPPPKVLILLTAVNEEALLPTLLSRCQRLELRRLPEERLADILSLEHGVAPDDASLLARLSGGRLGWAVAAATDPKVLEQRQQRLDDVLSAVDGGLERRFQYAQELAFQYGRDRAAVQEALSLWLAWWRDMLMLKEEVAELVAGPDWRESLEARAGRFSAEQVAGVVREVVATQERLEHNAIPRITLDVLMLTLPAAPA